MPIYEYEHLEEFCIQGKIFEIKQSIHDKTLVKCPYCQEAVRRRISLVGLSIPKMNSEIRDLGFTKLVKRDKGVYENSGNRRWC